jgi:hypothetical protein
MRAFFFLLLAGCATSHSDFDTDSGDQPDASPPMDAAKETTPEAAPMACANGVKDGNESDVDCGGGMCNACPDDKLCAKPTDCANGSCFSGHCGPRMWFVESNGSDTPVVGNMMWTPSAGTSIKAMLWAPSLVYLRWSGTLRFAGGGNGICHVGQRFVIDGTPTGDPNWGNAIMVQRGSTRWHEPFNLEMAVPLGQGMHTITTEMDNASGGYATCNLDGDTGAPYDRSRLAVAAFDPASAWYAESSGDTGALGPSGWVDIPGAALTIPLASASHVQFTMQGTENVGAPYGHCAYRLVLDNTPLGDANHGQSISVGDASGGWWAPVGLKYGQDLPVGSHSVRAQMRNSAGAGVCQAGQGNNAYARFHLLATASAQGGFTQSFESTGGSQVLGSSSPWTPVGGLQASFNLGGATTYMLVEVAGTQRTGSGSSGQCAYRLVVDGTPQGDMNWGTAVNVSDLANAWWTHTGMLWGSKLNTGLHSVSLEVRNGGNTGDCGVNGDGLPYGRVRMLLRSF